LANASSDDYLVRTLLLSRSDWDLCLDASGNIAIASNPYAIAQDVASAVRLFKGELYYDTTKGVPHFQEILGHHPPLSVLKAAIVTAALTVPEVVTANVYVSAIAGREIVGQVQVTDSSGVTSVLTGGFTTTTPI
jgi:hypothetical protein